MKILSFPVVQSTLILELKKQLHFRDAIKILDLLTSLLESFNLDALSHAARDGVLRVPTFVQAVTWIIVLTDAHISAFELEQQLNSIRFTTNCKRLLVESMVSECLNKIIFYYASSSSGDAFSDRQLTLIFLGFGLKIFVCRQVTIWGFRNPVCPSVPREKKSP